MSALYVGLISGTSADGIDAALVRFEPAFEVCTALTVPYPDDLRRRLLDLTAADAAIPLDAYGVLDIEVGRCFAAAALAVLKAAKVEPNAVAAIGSHGQTVRHRPDGAAPFTLQIGDAASIAEITGITTVADFRRADLAAGGQGAPLAPGFHAAVLTDRRPCAVLNLGGIANLSLIDADAHVVGFDSGPASCLLDAWHARHCGGAFDRDGAWAESGTVDSALLASLLADPYFARPAPKSSGREYFNLDWLDAHVGQHATAAADVQATLLALTARSIADALMPWRERIGEVIACGGGVHNQALMSTLAQMMHPLPLHVSGKYGLDPDFVEASLFAWLAWRRLQDQPGNMPAVTGARGLRRLGAIHAAPS